MDVFGKDKMVFDEHIPKGQENSDYRHKQENHHGFSASGRHIMIITHIINFVYGTSFFMQASAFPVSIT